MTRCVSLHCLVGRFLCIFVLCSSFVNGAYSLSCECTGVCAGTSPAAVQRSSSAVTFAVSPYRLAVASEKVYTPYQTYRVSIIARSPIDTFSLCISRPSGAEASSDGFIRRFLPYHARLRQDCSNLVQQSAAFRRRTYGMIQLRWRAPSQAMGCFVFNMCAQLSGNTPQTHVQHQVTLCAAQYRRFEAATATTPALDFVPPSGDMDPSDSRQASLDIHSIDENDQVAPGPTQVYSYQTPYEVRIVTTSMFSECYLAINVEEDYGEVADTGYFTKRQIGSFERRWRGHNDVLSCSSPLPTNVTNVIWTSPANAVCLSFRVWHSYKPGKFVETRKKFCKSAWVPVCPNSRSAAFPNFQPPAQTERVDSAELRLERWHNSTRSWQRAVDATSFRPAALYRVTLSVSSGGGAFPSCYISSVAQGNSNQNKDEHGYFLDKPMHSPEKCYQGYSNILTCGQQDNAQPRRSLRVTWMSPTSRTSCVELRFWLGSEGSGKLTSHFQQLCRLVYIPLQGSSTTSRISAPSTYKPTVLPVRYPGPVRTGQNARVSLNEWREDEGVSDDSSAYYYADQEYLVSVKLNAPFKRCFMMSSSIPAAESLSSGQFTRRHRSGLETLLSPYSNVIECTTTSHSGGVVNRNSSRIVWRAPGPSSVCVDITYWLELNEGTLTKITQPFCQMKAQLYRSGCPEGSHVDCQRCPGESSPFYALSGGDASLLQSSRLACCAGLPYDQMSTMCCGNTIQPMLRGSNGINFQCCGNNQYYDTAVSSCCQGNKQDGSSTRYRCCRDQSFNHALVAGGGGGGGGGGVTACCADKPYNTNKQKCCSGELHNTWEGTVAADLRCCPGLNVPYNPSTHRCLWCRIDAPRVVQPLNIPISCCGKLPYNATEKVCCSQEAQLLVSAISANSGCCAGEVYDHGSSKCCSNKIVTAAGGVAVTATWSCCGDDGIYDTATHGCCDGTAIFNRQTQQCLWCQGRQSVVERNGAYRCCASQAFSRLEQVCCHGNLKPLPKIHTDLRTLPDYSCCGEVVFDVTRSTCCSQENSQLAAGASSSNKRCCGQTQLYTVSSERCVQCTGGAPTIVPLDRAIYCCSRTPYVDGIEVCCADGSVAKIDLSRPVSAQPYYLCCANRLVYDSRREKCCPGGRLTDGQSQC